MKPQPPTARPPRLFGLWRDVDVHGRSGTGLVAWGVEWPDGRAVTWWAQSPVGVHQVSVWQSLAEVTRTHGHGARTRIVHLGQVAAVEQFDTVRARAAAAAYAAAVATARPESVEHLHHAIVCAGVLPGILDAYDRLAAGYAAAVAELEQLRAENRAMQDALDAIAEGAGRGA